MIGVDVSRGAVGRKGWVLGSLLCWWSCTNTPWVWVLPSPDVYLGVQALEQQDCGPHLWLQRLLSVGLRTGTLEALSLGWILCGGWRGT